MNDIRPRTYVPQETVQAALRTVQAAPAAPVEPIMSTAGTAQAVQITPAAPAVPEVRQDIGEEILPEEEHAEPLVQETVPQEGQAMFDSSNLDLEDLWRDVMEEGEVSSGSFNLIRSWTTLKDVRQGTYTISVSTDFARKHVQEKMDTIDKIMSSILRRPMKGGIVVEKHKEFIEKRPETDYVREAKEVLGLDIIVEE